MYHLFKHKEQEERMIGTWKNKSVAMGGAVAVGVSQFASTASDSGAAITDWLPTIIQIVMLVVIIGLLTKMFKGFGK